MKLKIIPLLLVALLLIGCTATQESDVGGSGIVHVTNQNFDAEVLESDKIVLLDFYADWCAPCKRMEPILEEIASENATVVVGKINVDNERALSNRFDIEAMPTLVVIKNGKEVTRAVGYRSKSAILAMLQL